MSWERVVGRASCGSCGAELWRGTPFRRSGRERNLVRCATCAKRLFGEDVPEVIEGPDPREGVPQPSLGLDVKRTSHGFMTAAEAGRLVRQQFARRQAAKERGA